MFWISEIYYGQNKFIMVKIIWIWISVANNPGVNVFNGLEDLKAAIYAGPNHTDDGIHSDHGLG